MRRLTLTALIILCAAMAQLAAASPLPPTPVPAADANPSAWQVALGRLDASRASGARTLVAVIDGRLGTDGDRLLGGRIATRQDAVRATSRRRGAVTGHALLVSGILAGGQAGACPACRVIAVGAMERTRQGVVADQRTLALALRRARRAGARVVNMSLGGLTCGPQLRREVSRAVDAGVVVVAAAGNNAGQSAMLCPALLPDVVSVGALTHADGALRPTYAGQTFRPTVWAQGEWVLGGQAPDGSALWSTGSSFAAPQVAGAIAALIAQPGWRVRDRAGVRRVIARLADTARPLSDGRLLLDAAALLGSAPGEGASFTDASGQMVVDTRTGGPRELCAADGEPLQVRATATLAGPPATHRDPQGQVGPPPAGAWQRVSAVLIPAGSLASLTVERTGAGRRPVVLAGPGECPAPAPAGG